MPAAKDDLNNYASSALDGVEAQFSNSNRPKWLTTDARWQSKTRLLSFT